MSHSLWDPSDKGLDKGTDSRRYRQNEIQKMFGGLKDVERYEKQFKEATLPYTNAIDHVNTSKAKYHQDKGFKQFKITNLSEVLRIVRKFSP